MLGNNSKRLIIVCDEKTKEYANYLRQLISVKDDKDGEVVGTVDGTLDVAVWLEKDYIANCATISSNEHILFMGVNKTSKSEFSSMKEEFNMFGMKYGWLGKRAMMQVDDSALDELGYKNFIDFCGTYEKKFEELVYKDTETSKEKKNVSPNVAIGAAGAAAAVAILAPIVAVGVGAGAVVGVVAGGAIKGITSLSVRKKIKDQQYRALTVILYMDGLQSFLEG